MVFILLFFAMDKQAQEKLIRWMAFNIKNQRKEFFSL